MSSWHRIHNYVERCCSFQTDQQHVIMLCLFVYSRQLLSSPGRVVWVTAPSWTTTKSWRTSHRHSRPCASRRSSLAWWPRIWPDASREFRSECDMCRIEREKCVYVVLIGSTEGHCIVSFDWQGRMYDSIMYYMMTGMAMSLAYVIGYHIMRFYSLIYASQYASVLFMRMWRACVVYYTIDWLIPASTVYQSNVHLLWRSVKREDYANTFEFLDKLGANLSAKMGAWLNQPEARL